MANFHNCVAVQFSKTATYKFGEYVMYNDTLYRCVESNYTAGEFSLDNFEKTYLADAVNNTNVIDNNIAPVYDSTLTYDVKDCVLYNGELYVCMTAVESAEEFDSEKWLRAYIADVMEGDITVTSGELSYIANEYDESVSYEIGEVVAYNEYMYECVESTTGVFDESKWKRTYISENTLRDQNGLHNMFGANLICYPIRNLLNNSITIETNGHKYIGIIVDTNSGNASTLKLYGSSDGTSFTVIDSFADGKVAKIYDISKHSHVKYESKNTNSAYSSSGVMFLTNDNVGLQIKL